MNLRPLGYEHYDARLWRFTQSPVRAVTWADGVRLFVSVLLHLPRLNLSRRVSCTNPCTTPIGPTRRFRLMVPRQGSQVGGGQYGLEPGAVFLLAPAGQVPQAQMPSLA